MRKDNPNLDINEDAAPTRGQIEAWITEAKSRSRGKTIKEKQNDIQKDVAAKFLTFGYTQAQVDAMLSDMASYPAYEYAENPGREV